MYITGNKEKIIKEGLIWYVKKRRKAKIKLIKNFLW